MVRTLPCPGKFTAKLSAQPMPPPWQILPKLDSLHFLRLVVRSCCAGHVGGPAAAAVAAAAAAVGCAAVVQKHFLGLCGWGSPPNASLEHSIVPATSSAQPQCLGAPYLTKPWHSQGLSPCSSAHSSHSTSGADGRTHRSTGETVVCPAAAAAHVHKGHVYACGVSAGGGIWAVRQSGRLCKARPDTA